MLICCSWPQISVLCCYPGSLFFNIEAADQLYPPEIRHVCNFEWSPAEQAPLAQISFIGYMLPNYYVSDYFKQHLLFADFILHFFY